MPDLIALLLDTPGPKGFFQSPSYLLGVPLLALGLLGVLIALAPIELRWPQPAVRPQEEVHYVSAEGHPSSLEYVRVGLILAVVTVLEVALYYIDIARGPYIVVLLIASASKYVLVVLYFMHLKFDSRVFSIMFAGGMLLVLSLFIVVLSSLGSSLV